MSTDRVRVFVAIVIGSTAVLSAAACAPRQARTGSETSSIEAVLASIPDQPTARLDRELAAKLVLLPLACVDRPFPNKPGHVYDSLDSLRPPQAATPAFYGCFDWHSAVHGHWSMVRILRRFVDLEQAPKVKAALRSHLSAPTLARELVFFQQKRNRLFERPYGWAWLLRLAAELHQWRDPLAQQLAAALAPLARHMGRMTIDYLKRLSAPIRVGTHQNTAFALAHMLDYADVTGDGVLAAAIRKRARDFYGKDLDCPTHYEPSGEDFISPCLAEADLMSRVLAPRRFPEWLDRFLPAVTSGRFAPLLRPLEIRDRHDPRIGHLIGLWFHRAWCYGRIAAALADGDHRKPLFQKLRRLHLSVGLSQMFDSGYGGAHWLASFALFALD